MSRLKVVKLEGYGNIKFYRDEMLDQYRAVECPHIFFGFHLAEEQEKKFRTAQEIVRDALEVFWQEIADAYPQAESGDLTPQTTLALESMADAAVEEWIQFNIEGKREGK